MDVLKLEQQREALEATLRQLRLNLRTWQIWEAEYEGLKEEIHKVRQGASVEDLRQIAASYSGDLVNENEIVQLSGLDKNDIRSPQQIIDLIDHRLEYVQRNIDSIQRQFFSLEAKQEELTFVAANRGIENMLPLTEILEELDDDGNVMSSSVSQPEEMTAKAVAALKSVELGASDTKKALARNAASEPRAENQLVGLKSAMTNSCTPTPTVSPAQSGNAEDVSTTVEGDSRIEGACPPVRPRPSVRKKSVSFTADTKFLHEDARTLSEGGKKSVAFAPKIAVMPAAPPPDTRTVSFSPKIEEIPPEFCERDQQSTHSLSRSNIMEPSRSDGPVAVPGHQRITDNNGLGVLSGESSEDAQIRSEMLDYNMSEVGHILDNIYTPIRHPTGSVNGPPFDDDDTSSQDTTSEYPEDDNTPSETGLSDAEDSEDGCGRSKRSVISERYHKKMREVEHRLMRNLGPRPNDEPPETGLSVSDAEDVRQLVVTTQHSSGSASPCRNVEDDGPGPMWKPGVVMAANLTERPSASHGRPSKDSVDSSMGRSSFPSEFNRGQDSFAGAHASTSSQEPFLTMGEEKEAPKLSRFKAARIQHQK